MALFIFSIIFAIAALVSLAVRSVNQRSVVAKNATQTANRYAVTPVPFLGWTALSLAFVSALALFFSCVTQVGTKEIGVPTSFGAVGSKHYGAGFHLKAPWVKVHTMDGAIQTENDLKSSCLNVRIANNQTGCAEVSMQWRINPNQVDYLYKNYRSFDHVRDQLVARKLFSAVNEALASYNPLGGISAKGRANPLPQVSTMVYTLMKGKVRDVNGKPLIEVLNVQLPLVHFDQETQARINQLQQQVAMTAIAKQREQTNAAESQANKALTKGNTLTPLVLTSRCLDSLDSMIKAKMTPPIGFNCLGTSSVAGIIAPSK